jgi:hippurate hydrolase
MTRRVQLIERIASEGVEWRRELHRHPQTMYEEKFASDFICRKLDEWGITHEPGIATTGVVASIEGRLNQSGRAIALRADMDALNIVEASGQPWSSETPGKMHGCGHDGRVATLLTAARYLQETRDFDGVIRLIFQPAEEGGRGAFTMLQEGLLDRFPFDEIYGYHNWPWLPKGVFAIRSGLMLAATDFFEIRLNGKGGHAAMPHLCRDVIPATAQIVAALQTLVSRETDPLDSAVLSVTNVEAGSGAENVISPNARLSGTVRTFKQSTRDSMEARIKLIAEGIALAFGVESQFAYSRITEPVLNDPESTRQCQSAAAAIVGEHNVNDFDPIMGGEDFGGFLQARPGAFMAIGQGEAVTSPCNFGLHSPSYDFNDAIISLAAAYFAEIVERRLPLD